MAFKRSKKITLKNADMMKGKLGPKLRDVPDNFGETTRYCFIRLEETEDNTYAPAGLDKIPMTIEDLVNDGWNVKYTKPNEDGEQTPYLKVIAQFRRKDGEEVRNKPTIIKSIGGKTKMTLNEESVGDLDGDYIERIDHVDIRGWDYTEGKVSAYIVNMFVTVEDDPFKREYMYDDINQSPEDEEDVPF